MHLRTLSLTLSIVLVMGSRLPALGYLQPTTIPLSIDRRSPVLLAELMFKVPSIRASGNREPAALQQNGCNQEKPLTALLPETNIGWTVAANPTFFFNNSQTTTQLAEFILLDQDGRIVYEAMMELPDTPGIVSFRLPEEKGGSPPLEVGKRYQWYFALVCNPSDRSRDIALDGWIERVKPSSNLVAKLETADLSDLPGIYAQEGVWYETIDCLAQLREANPNDPQLAEDWKTLLESVNLGAIAQAPLVGSATTAEQQTKR
jgi:hypothetical protein